MNKAGVYKVVMWIPADFLNQGLYLAGLALSSMSPVVVHFYERDAIVFEVIENIDKRDADYKQNIPGVIRPKLNWDISTN